MVKRPQGTASSPLAPEAVARRHRERRRRYAIRALLRSVLVAGLLLTAFFVLPMRSVVAIGGVLALTGGLVVVVIALVWHIRMILTAPYPAARAVSALIVTVPLFLVVFATIYYLMSLDDTGAWSEPLTRMDALYFAVTVFSTVGFGDITAVSQTARVVTTLQMILGLALVGVVARVVVGAVQVNLRSRSED
jgi:voltage-gated potassium channel